MVRGSGGTTSGCMKEASSFSISDFCADDRSRFPSSRLASLIFFKMVRNWLAARFAADAGLLSSCASPAESFPKEAKPVSLLFDPGGFADAVRHQTDQALGQLRHFLYKIWEQ